MNNKKTNKKIGEVTNEEKKEITKLHGRKTALIELLKILNSTVPSQEEQDYLYSKATNELEKVELSLRKWWERIIQKYGLQNMEDRRLKIEFNTNRIYLVSND
ncbi:MAG: hypothetical protein A4E53_00795 [Pelotomaculum sp. PtaB.Bin104]|uniref:CXXX repeat peptide modification system protein n=1 Tax=Pelotomaculum isophthalicicum JI TaxID=947010 RepID=A0A9X4H7Q4_9FIRM|nr:CXXX repeat peptide modification system protein [Pelotomaculum isophthalicicum]MDF9409884.1 CXXX repeat peptide modification system protein [Pelotomaculum isophthalicicum JI]OPX90896.1 MAG: hypothetical protein A4E53_00795 [Pelotomaculum sp. PtaB.Bin104]